MTRDPVCGMPMQASPSAARSEFDGTIYLFCSSECLQRFKANPQQFAAREPQPARIPCCGFGMVRRTTQRGVA